MGNPDESVVFSKAVLEMFTVANDYCIFMSAIESYPETHILQYLQKISPLLYLKGSLLPKLHPSDPDSAVRFFTGEEWENLFNSLRKKLIPHDEFWFIDPEDQDYDNPVKGSLAEHYTDICQDMKDFILLYSQERFSARENAVFILQKSFAAHWGFKLVNAQRALHNLLYFSQKKF